MGLNSLRACLGLMGANTFLGLISMFASPFHVMQIMVLVAPLAEVKTFMLYVEFEFKILAEAAVGLLKNDEQKAAVRKLEGYSRLGTVEATMCSGPLRVGAGNSVCGGFAAAHWAGMLLFFATTVMIGSFGTSAWMTYHYMQAPKKKYREVAFIFVCVGAAVHGLVGIIYIFVVLFSLESAGSDSLLRGMVGPDQAFGMGWGIMMLVFMFIFHVILVILNANVKLKEEDILLDMRRQREFENEMMEEQYSQGYHPHGDSFYGGGVDAYAGYGQQQAYSQQGGQQQAYSQQGGQPAYSQQGGQPAYSQGQQPMAYSYTEQVVSSQGVQWAQQAPGYDVNTANYGGDAYGLAPPSRW